MFEVRKGDDSTIHGHPWRHSTGQVYRFQAVDHPIYENTDPKFSNREDIVARIDQLSTSLQSTLEKSRRKERWYWKEKMSASSKKPRRLFPKISKMIFSLLFLVLFRLSVFIRSVKKQLFYPLLFVCLDIDSGGNLHGPLDLKHSSRLDGMKKSSDSFFKRSWMEAQRSQSSARSEGSHTLIFFRIYV